MTSASALVPLWDRGAEWQRRPADGPGGALVPYLLTYYIEHDPYGLRCGPNCMAAERRGVTVNLLIDGFGQRLGGAPTPVEHRAALAVDA